MSQFSKLIISARKKRGLTQSSVATKLGVSAQFYGHVENNGVGLPCKYFKTIMRELNISKCDIERALVNDYLREMREWT